MSNDRLREARNLFAQGQIEKSHELCDELLQTMPDSADLHHLISLVLTQFGDIDSALTHICKAISLMPDCAQLHNNHGNIYLRSGDVDRAIKSYEQAINIDELYAPAYNNLGNCHFKKANLDEAKTFYIKALRLEPEFVDAHFNYARFLLAENNHMSARYVLTRAHQLNSKHPAVLGQLAELALAGEDFEQAIEYLSERLKIQPTHGDSYHSLGTALFQLGDFSDSADAFSYALELGTSATDAHFNLGNAKMELGEFKEALKQYMQQLETEPNSDTYYNIGVIHMAQDHHNDALGYFSAALKGDPKNCEVLQNMAAIYLKQNNRKKAIECYETVLTAQPGNQEIQHILNALAGGDTPDSPPSAYVKNLFNHYANYYDLHLQDHLHYDVPAQLARAIEEETQESKQDALRILDLGCGTGLMGEELADMASHLVGVDLSPNMISQAEKKGIYHDLMMGDITKIFKSQSDLDLVVAADVFTYIGNLDTIFTGVHSVLKEDGLFAFTIEKTHDADYILQKTIRYAHKKSYIAGLAEKHDFVTERCDNITLRRQHGHPIEGYLVILKKR